MNLSEISRDIFTPRLHLFIMKPENIADIARIFSESFDDLKLYGPDWANMDKAPVGDELDNMITEWIAEEENPEGFTFCAYDTQRQCLVGMGEVHHIDWSVPKGRIGYWMSSPEAGKGYASEIANALTRYVFSELGFKELILRAEVRNPASAKIAEKMGFEKRGTTTNNIGWNLDVYSRANLKGLPHMDIKFQ